MSGMRAGSATSSRRRSIDEDACHLVVKKSRTKGEHTREYKTHQPPHLQLKIKTHAGPTPRPRTDLAPGR